MKSIEHMMSCIPANAGRRGNINYFKCKEGPLKPFYSFFIFTLCLIGNVDTYPAYREVEHVPIKGEGAYFNYIRKIDKNDVHSILEIGSRDAKDAIELSDHFKCHVFAFECNPVAIEICKNNIGVNPNVTLIPLAVWHVEGPLTFYSISEGNIGASSCFEFNQDAKNYQDIVEEGLVQQPIIVDAIRLDNFLNAIDTESIDLLCMDVQGAALEVLKSLGKSLSKVKYIITELEVSPVYKGETVYKNIEQYLRGKGFIRVSPKLCPTDSFGDVFYVNKKLVNPSMIKKLKTRN